MTLPIAGPVTAAARNGIARVLRAGLPLAAGMALAAGCTTGGPPGAPAPAARYDAAAWAEVPGWGDAALAPSLRAFVVGCAALGSAGHWQRVCAVARGVPAGDEAAARAFVESAFRPYRVQSLDGSDEGLITGYYEPILSGRRAPAEGFRVPVFGVPEDLIAVDLAAVEPGVRTLSLRGRLEGRRLVPYYTRREIEGRARAGDDPARPDLPAPVLAWVADPVELFFLQVQGSGQVRLESGERLRLGYADHNGHPYRSLGRWLIDQGALEPERASMQAIKAWAVANPARVREALDQNPRYVFFRELPAGDEGPLGTLGVPLTAGHSVAVDRRYIPLGAPVFLATTDPLSREPLQRLMVAQDTGSAILGPVRADFFWGTGDEAGERAGRMGQAGRLWLLWPRGASPPEP